MRVFNRMGCCAAACVLGLGLFGVQGANAGGPPPSACLADIDGDGQVGLGDIAIIIQFWGQTVNCNDGDPCTEDFCDPCTGQCVHAPLPNCCQTAAQCDDGNACTTDICVQGVCVHQPLNCDDGNPCTIDSCVNGQCVNIPVNCDDGNPCTIDSCVNGQCIHQFAPAGTPCIGPSPCRRYACNGQGGCIDIGAAPNGTPCDDGNPCTINDVCVNGVCAGMPINCNDGNACTADSCVNGQCVFTPLPDGSPCNDGNPCTIEDVCIGGVCAGIPINCDDGNPCTEDLCIDGVCFHVPVEDGMPCNDNNPCTLNDRCVAGTCMGVPIQCPPGMVCINGNCVINPN